MTAKVQFQTLRFQHLDPVPEMTFILDHTLSLEQSCLSNDQSYIPFVCLRGDDPHWVHTCFWCTEKSVLGFLGSPFSYRQPSAAQSNHPLLDHLCKHCAPKHSKTQTQWFLNILDLLQHYVYPFHSHSPKSYRHIFDFPELKWITMKWFWKHFWDFCQFL